jgi:hypothetical protein
MGPAIRILGVLVAAAGGIFFLQGMRLVPRDSFLSHSFMFGSQTWIVAGVVLFVAGLALIFLGARRRRR